MPAPATAAEPPAIGLHGAVINIEVSAWCRCGFTVQNGFGVGNKSTARTELRNISMNSRNLARTSQLRRLEQTTASRLPK
jgi:hypothetical protein